MRSRGYGSAKSTSFQIYRLTSRDGILMGAMAVLVAGVLLAGSYDAVFTPAIAVDQLSWGFAVYCLFLLIPVALYVKEAIVWHISISRI